MGVSTTPCAVVITPALADEPLSVADIVKSIVKGVSSILIFSVVVAGVCYFRYFYPMHIEVLYILFLLSIAIQLGYVLYFFVHVFSLVQRPHEYQPVKPVSVIICARNEARNLEQNLPAILAQRYSNDAGNPIFEVVVVDDCSEDETAALLTGFCIAHPNLRVVHIDKAEERMFPGKKHALGKGVAAAKNELLIFTDADCIPAGPDWLLYMAQPFHRGKEIVAGYGKYRHTVNWLNTFTRWETMHAFLQLATYARKDKPYMGVGRNLGCTKQLFLAAQQTPEWSALPSGDDDLLVRAAATGDNMAVVTIPAAFTLTDAKDDWEKWTSQKQRHLSTGKYYKWRIKLLLGAYGFSHAFAWLCFFALLYTAYRWEVLAIMVLRSTVYWMVWQRGACLLREKKLVRYFPLLDFGWFLYNFAFFPYISWKNKQQWT